MLSKKILFAMMAVPILWLSYGAMLFLFTTLETRTIVIIILCCPIFSYLGVQAVEVRNLFTEMDLILLGRHVGHERPKARFPSSTT